MSTSAKICFGSCRGKRVYELNSLQTEQYLSVARSSKLKKQLKEHREDLKERGYARSIFAGWRDEMFYGDEK